MRRLSMLAAVAVFYLATGGTAPASHCAHPACSFSAFYYQSPGGIGSRPRPRQYERTATPSDVPYSRSCGKGRVWERGRCVDARSTR